MSKHRKPTAVNIFSHPMRFRPKHCAGETCLHDHPNDKRPSLPLWRPLRAVSR